MSRIKNAGTIIQPRSPYETAERKPIEQTAGRSLGGGGNSGGNSNSTKVPERDPGIVAMLRGGPKTTGYGGMAMVNGGAAAPSNPPLKSEPEPKTPKAKPRDFGMER